MKNENYILNHPYFGEATGEIVNIYYEGELLEAYKGQTVAAALMVNNVKKLGISRKLQQSRGVYCNNGRCFSCYMTINGKEHVRACMTLVEPGMEIKNNSSDPNVRSNHHGD